MIKTVLVFGTFDIIHPGHRWFLRHAGELGERIIAVVARDSFVKELKGKAPVSDQKTRMKTLKESGLVDEVMLADETIGTYGVLKQVKPDIICLGHDQRELKDNLEAYMAKHYREEESPRIHTLKPWLRWIYNSSLRNKAFFKRSSKHVLLLQFLMIISMMIFGFSWVSGKRLSELNAPILVAYLRFNLSALCFFPLLFIRKSPVKPLNKTGWLYLLAASLLLVAYNFLFLFGLSANLAGKGGLIVTTMSPLFTFIIVSAISGSMRVKKRLYGILIGLCAGIILVEPWNSSLDEFGDPGNITFVLAALAWTLLTLIARPAQEQLGFRRFNFGLYTIASLITLPIIIWGMGFGILKSFDTAMWMDIIFLSAGVGAFGTGIYFITVKTIGAQRANSFIYLVPVAVIGFTWLGLGEVPEILTIIGAATAVTAVILVNSR